MPNFIDTNTLPIDYFEKDIDEEKYNIEEEEDDRDFEMEQQLGF